ncbi:hypothetical protein J2T37_001204 [Neisseria perflava]|nr:hypothetical protein [Neisseria perflava]MCP1773327.1 hypothetical protein [Neisseria perflava]
MQHRRRQVIFQAAKRAAFIRRANLRHAAKAR